MELQNYDSHWVATRLPKSVMGAMHEFRDKCFLAGGFIRACVAHEQVNDIDLFTPSKEVCDQLVGYLKGAVSVRKVIQTDNAMTLISDRFPCPVQVIHRWNFASPSSCIQSFDFTIARAIAWVNADKEWKTECDERFYPDLAAKRLVYCSPVRIEECGGSMLRVMKFVERGYRIPPESLAAVAVRWMTGVRPEVLTFRESEEQVAKVMAGLLREVDPNTNPFKHFGGVGG